MSLDIKKIETNKANINQVPNAEAGLIPEHPFRWYLCGASHSGKTNLLLNLLSRTEFYKDYFDIYVISPTAGELDDSYKVLNLPKERYFYPNIMVLQRLFEIQQQKIQEEGTVKPVLLVLDDCISYKQFINHKDFLKLFCMGRHYQCSIIATSQAYHRLPKSCRLQCSAISFFRGSQKEVEVIVEDFCPAGLSKRQFTKVVNSTTTEKYSFLQIDLSKSVDKGRYRKGFNNDRVV